MTCERDPGVCVGGLGGGTKFRKLGARRKSPLRTREPVFCGSSLKKDGFVFISARGRDGDSKVVKFWLSKAVASGGVAGETCVSGRLHRVFRLGIAANGFARSRLFQLFGILHRFGGANMDAEGTVGQKGCPFVRKDLKACSALVFKSYRSEERPQKRTSRNMSKFWPKRAHGIFHGKIPEVVLRRGSAPGQRPRGGVE